MSTPARIPPIPVTGPLGFVVKRFSKKLLGEVPESMGVLWHHRPVLLGLSGLGRKVQRWDRLDPNLKSYAHLATAALVGCSACLDFAYFQAHHDGLDLGKASQVPRWRDAAVFTPLERDVMEYAEAMTVTPPQVTDELSARLLDQLGPAGLIELTAIVGFANQTSRSNTALGIESEGFSDACPVPLVAPASRLARA